MSTPWRPEPSPDQLPGRVNTHDVDGARRRLYLWSAVAGVLGSAYAYVTFLRMKEIAERLPGWPRGFPTGAALLFTGLSLFALGLLTVWAMRPSRLRQALDASGRISEETDTRIADFGRAAEGYFEQSRNLADAADDELNQGLRLRDVGKEKIIRVAQKAAVLAGVRRLVLPDAANLGPFHQDERDHAEAYLETAARRRATAAQLLSRSPDFTVETPLANPWIIRTLDRSAAPNPDYVDPARLTGRPKRGIGMVWKALAVLAVLALIALAVFAATGASAAPPQSATSHTGATSMAPPSGPVPAAGTYSFIGKVDGHPVRWPCTTPITVRLNGPAPKEAPGLLAKEVADLRAASGLRLAIGSPSDISPTDLTSGVIAISYLPTAQFDEATDGAAAGASDAIGDTQAQWSDTGQITSAWVVIDADNESSKVGTPDGFTVLAHELGHAVGLGHAEDKHEVMYPIINGMVRWGVGDRYALKMVGCS